MKSRLLLSLCRSLGLLLIALIAILLAFLVWHGLGAFNYQLFFGQTPFFDAILGRKPVWDGIWPAMLGTGCLVVLSIGIALPPGLGCGIYLSQFGNRPAGRWIRLGLDVLAGTPSIVMGLFGFTLILFLRHTLFPGANTSLILAAFCLCLLILPALTITICEALETVPFSLKLTGIALGFTARQNLLHIILPAARQGIHAGIILAIGRAAEDTAVIMLTGAVANAGLPAGLDQKFEALSFSIFYTSAQYQNEDELAAGFATAIVLLLLSACMLFMAGMLENSFRQKWRGQP